MLKFIIRQEYSLIPIRFSSLLNPTDMVFFTEINSLFFCPFWVKLQPKKRPVLLQCSLIPILNLEFSILFDIKKRSFVSLLIDHFFSSAIPFGQIRFPMNQLERNFSVPDSWKNFNNNCRLQIYSLWILRIYCLWIGFFLEIHWWYSGCFNRSS